jgi:hypothetical protein
MTCTPSTPKGVSKLNIASVIASLINLADPERNSNTNERKAAWGKAQELMDKYGVSFMAAGVDYATAERVCHQTFQEEVQSSWLSRLFGGGKSQYSESPRQAEYRSNWGTRGQYHEQSESQEGGGNGWSAECGAAFSAQAEDWLNEYQDYQGPVPFGIS